MLTLIIFIIKIHYKTISESCATVVPQVSLESGSAGDGCISHLLLNPICCRTPLFLQEGMRTNESNRVPGLLGKWSCDFSHLLWWLQGVPVPQSMLRAASQDATAFPPPHICLSLVVTCGHFCTTKKRVW